MILGIDTSSAATSVAVIDGETVLVERTHVDARRHAEVFAPLLDEVLAEVDADLIDVVACGVGPGPYTGLRVGVASALALGAVWQVPVHGVCSLDAVAAAAQEDRPGRAVTVAVDARRSEVYWAEYDADGHRVRGPRVMSAGLLTSDAVSDLPGAAWIARCAARALAVGDRPPAIDLPLDVHGDDTGSTADALAGARLLLPRPLYLRRPDAVASRP
jgi:tRNA threonylcarbamoyl adenosine modification protein YeaZ